MRLAVLALAVALSLTACGNRDGEPADMEAPELGACRVLTSDEVAQPADDTAPVPCAEAHTAETYAVGDLPSDFDDVDYDDSELGAWAYAKCSDGFREFLGADESLVMRTVVSWAWFRPSQDAWDEGARWFRCDVVGGGEQSKEYVDLPTSARDLLLGRPKDSWMVCADGATVAGSVKVPCTEAHTWRAVTTISLGERKDDYPGDRMVEVTTRDFCSKSVGAWLNYPVDYDFGYTWFHEAEWQAGNRRSVCWAKTAQ
ncbi:septum formation family protein [Nocardioides sp. YIM 152315]|uniref:septum formation family protein n=1 Tax=Nocardioides sp. YIM 152315 TaxID=3031760 RepID=UPI0023DA08A7|nr:septum formation family protein [Nocardioides sp. YIM 152315]MDF1603852.1 septum formation family protein [Nocardioides sp. YIM 152315]